MSNNQTEQALCVSLAITSLAGNPQERHVTVRCGETVLHEATLDIADSTCRDAFLDDVETRASSRNITFNRDLFEQRLIDGAEETTAGSSILRAFGIDVLMELEDQSILCWIPATGKRWRIKSPAGWKVAEMLQAMGQQAVDVLWRDHDSPPPAGRYTPTELCEAIAVAAATAPRAATSRLVGQGVWRHDGRLLIVNGGEANLYNGSTFLPQRHPRLGSKIIEFNASETWFPRVIQETAAMTLERSRPALQRLRGILEHWHWSHAVDPEVVAALIAATFVQAVWTWRPLASIIGPSDAGKSTLLQQVIVPVLGEWTIAADRSTEAGLRQAIGNDAAPVLIDEFDRYRQRQQVLELFRTSSRGGEVLRGTTDQAGIRYGVRHIAWFAAIESGDVWGQDRNRFIRLELRPPERRGDLQLPGSQELGELGRELAAAAIWAALTAVPLADSIKSTHVPGVHGRLVESFAVPAAMHAVMTHGRGVSRDVAVETLERMINGRAVLIGQGERDEVQLLRDILSSTVRVPEPGPGGTGTVHVERTVAQILSTDTRPSGRPSLDTPNGAALTSVATAGVRLYTPRDGGGTRIFIADDIVRRRLLQDTRWSESRLDQLLSRLAGSEREQQRLDGTVRCWGLSLPWAGCLAELGGQDKGQDNENA
jgi:hypothetical protein